MNEKMDDAYANAVSRKEAITVEIARHRERINMLKKESKRINEWLTGYSHYRDAPPDALFDPPARPANPAKELITDQVRQLISKKGAPMSRRDLNTGLTNEGIILEGNNPDMILSTMLWRMKSKVVHLKKFGYWLAERDYAPAGYKAAPAAG